METNSTKIIRSVNTSKHNFTPISNTLIRNKTLSLSAKGLIIFIVSLPEDWTIYKSWVQKELGLGRFQFDRIWKECIEAGYIKTIKWKNKDGKFCYHHEVADNLSVVGFTDVGKTDVGKADTIIKTEEEKKEEIKERINNNSIADQNNSIIDLFNSNPDAFTKEFVKNYISTNR